MTPEDRFITRVTTLIAGIIATVLTVTVTGGYFALSYQYLIGTLDAQADTSASSVTGLITSNPIMWRFEEVRLMELLERRSREGIPEIRRILDRQGNVIAETRDHLPQPTVSIRQDIYDAGTPVAQIEISRSLSPILWKTALVAAGALMTGGFVFFILRILPLRAVRRAHRSLRESEEKFRSLYESMKEGMALHRIISDPSGARVSFSVVDVNPACEEMLGIKRHQIIDMKGPDVFSGAMMGHLTDILHVVKTGRSLSFEIAQPETNRFFNVSVFRPEPGLFATLLEDITERKKSEEQIQCLAYSDSLTGLPNRTLFLDRLDQALARARRDRTKVALLFIDLDRFKVVNDTLGHTGGDRLLIQVSRRLKAAVRSSDTLARLGGDEFVVLLSFTGAELSVVPVARHLIDAITPPYTIVGREVYTSASIGIAIFPDDGGDADTLLRCADMAMYAVKEGGRNGYEFFSREMNRKAHERMEMESDLRHALEQGDFVLEYEPIITAHNGCLAGAEVLLLWQHPEQGRILPAAFINVAEDSDLIIRLGEWVLRTACRKLRRWLDAGIAPSRISVNVSAQQFAQANFIEMVRSILAESEIEGRYLELELTETTLMGNAEATVRALQGLKGLDVSIAVDDFGTGHSSLGYLKDFPLDRIKIDRSFVRDLSRNPDDRAIVGAIIALAGKLKMKVVAEGVETAEQEALLLENGTTELQGFRYSGPLPEERFEELLRQEADTPPVVAPAELTLSLW